MARNQKFQPHQPSGEGVSAYDLTKSQEAVARALDPLTERPHLDSELLEDVDLTTGTTLVQHKLGRDYRGFWVVDRSANAVVYRDTTVTGDANLFLPLIASAAVTVSLVVF